METEDNQVEGTAQFAPVGENMHSADLLPSDYIPFFSDQPEDNNGDQNMNDVSAVPDNQVEGTAQFAPVGENMHSADLLPSDYIPFFSDQPEDNNGDQNMNDVSAVPDAAAPAATEGTQSGAKRRKKKKKKKKPNAAPADGAPSAPAIGKPSSTAIAAPTPATSAGAPKAAVGTRVEVAAGVPVVAVAVAAAAAGAQKQGAAATSGPTLTKNKKRKIKKKLRIKLLKASGVQVPPSPAELRKRKLKKKRRKERLKSVGQIAAAQAETQPSDVPMEESSKDLDKDELQVDQVTKEAGGDSVVLAAEPADGLAERQQPVAAAALARGHAAALELQRPGEGATDRAAEHLAGRYGPAAHAAVMLKEELAVLH